MIQALEQFTPDHKVKLSVPLIATYLKHGYNRNQIAKLCNVDHSAVYQYCKRYYDKLRPLIDTTDSYAATVADHVANEAKHKLLDIISTTDDWDKRDLIPLTAVSDRHTTQARLLSDKSTSNVSMSVNDNNLREIEIEEAQLLKDLDKLDSGGGKGG